MASTSRLTHPPFASSIDEARALIQQCAEPHKVGELVKEAIFRGKNHLLKRIKIIPFGAASVGAALGIMVQESRFPRPSCVFLDGEKVLESNWPIYLISLFMTFFYFILFSPFVRAISLVSIMV